MKSGQIAVLLMVIVIAAIVCMGMFVWAKRNVAETKTINEEQKAFFVKKVDSLGAKIGQLEEVLAVPAGSRDTMYSRMMRDEIDFLRRRIDILVDSSMAASGVDSVSYFIQRLRDSSFITHSGDYDQPAVWFIAAERLGAMGRQAVGPLVRHLDSAQGFDFEQTVRALNLAAQQQSVRSITGGDLPTLAPGTTGPEAGVDAWRAWATKWHFL